MGQDIPHGGNLTEARARFPEARGPWLDLSTGISPFPYPLPEFSAEAFTRLPEPADVTQLQELAARRYGADDPTQVVAAPGTQILLPLIAKLLPPGRARVAGPTYAEHARAAALAGHEVVAEGPAELLTIVNPNNPDGRFRTRSEMLALRPPEGLLVADEAFMEAAPSDEGLAGEVGEGVIVLRSFGKFHGLAGLRLGFAIASASTAARLRDALGPWAVSGPALAVGLAALADEAWAAAMRLRLAEAAAALDGVLAAGGCRVLGGTSLFRLAEVPPGTYERLGRSGILVRRFDYWPDRIRFGLPPDAASLRRLAEALA